MVAADGGLLPSSAFRDLQLDGIVRAAGRRIEAARLCGGELPYFGGEAAGDVVAFGLLDATHALAERDGAGGGVVAGFFDAEDRLVEVFEPEASDFDGSFGHEALALPLACKPEAAVGVAMKYQADGADDFLRGVVFEAERPVPLVAAGNGGEC